MIKKFAKLFEAGDYADKGVSVAETDLENIVNGFEPIPIKVEHTDTVFDDKMGTVTGVFTDKGSLYGALEFDEDMWKALNKIQAKKLSVGLKKDLTGLTEVSIVKQPRVADARVFCFSGDLQFLGGNDQQADLMSVLGKNKEIKDYGADWVVYSENGELWKGFYRADETGKITLEMPFKVKAEYVECAPKIVVPYTEENTNMEERKNDVVFAENETLRKQNEELQKRVEALLFSAKETAVDTKLNALVNDGKITPAGKDIAKAIMMSASETVAFSGGNVSVAELFVKFIDTMPKAEAEVKEFKVLPDETEKKDETFFSDDAMKLLKGLGANVENVAKAIGGKN